MGLGKIPQNQLTVKYTSGNEYLDIITYKEYQGYYYELNNKTYAGQNYNVSASELIKSNSDKVNKMRLNPATALYSLISKTNLPIIPKITSIPYNPSAEFKLFEPTSPSGKTPTIFFVKKINEPSIKQIDESTFRSLQSNPLYQTTFIGYYNHQTQTQIQAQQQIPGLENFLG
jgi:hypothetical protein